MFYFFVLRHYFPFQCFYGPSMNSTSSTHEGSFHCTTFYGPHFELGFHPLELIFLLYYHHLLNIEGSFKFEKND